jgi:hypothetical protein
MFFCDIHAFSISEIGFFITLAVLREVASSFAFLLPLASRGEMKAFRAAVSEKSVAEF